MFLIVEGEMKERLYILHFFLLRDRSKSKFTNYSYFEL